MDIIKTSYKITGFQKVNGGCVLLGPDFPLGFFLSKEKYAGNMPPTVNWPWKKWILTVSRLDNFIVSADLNGVKLFEIAEENYPENLKDIIKREQELKKEAEERRKAKQEKLKQAVTAYLLTFPVNRYLEQEASVLPICLRAYLKLHLFCGKRTDDRMQRLSLMLALLKVVNQWCNRYMRKNEAFGAIAASFRFSGSTFLYDDIELLKTYATEEQMVLFKDYDEVKELIEDQLPPVEDKRLRDYLIWLAQEIACVYSSDYSDFDRHHLKNAWGNRICSDEEDYRRMCVEMKMPVHTNLILPEIFSKEKLNNFFNAYAL